MKAKRYNKGKVQWTQLEFKSLVPMIRVLEYGEKKYKERSNWKKPFPRHELLDSMMRHVAALMDNEDFDSETKQSHAAHVMANALFFIHHFVNKKK